MPTLRAVRLHLLTAAAVVLVAAAWPPPHSPTPRSTSDCSLLPFLRYVPREPSPCLLRVHLLQQSPRAAPLLGVEPLSRDAMGLPASGPARAGWR